MKKKLAIPHTPGPWRLVHTGDFSHGHNHENVTTHIATVGGNIATVHPCANPRKAFNDSRLPDTTQDKMEPIGQANAVLIQHAPDLLQALEDVVFATAGLDSPIANAARTQAERAIKKAKGG